MVIVDIAQEEAENISHILSIIFLKNVIANVNNLIKIPKLH